MKPFYISRMKFFDIIACIPCIPDIQLSEAGETFIYAYLSQAQEQKIKEKFGDSVIWA